jgi:lactoylglutathione lyase/glyoxylase I family protein
MDTPPSGPRPNFLLDHTGIVVPDLDAAVRFYVNAFGMTVLSRESDTDVDSAAIGIPGQPVRLRGAILKAGRTNLELHEYLTPRGIGSRNVFDEGIGHIAFAVTEIRAAYDYLRALGVTFNTEPNLITDGALAGRWWVYGKDPWGNVLELGQDPLKEIHE